MRKKLLLLGRTGAGKTSMRAIIFSNYLAKDTVRLGITANIEHSHVRLLGSLVLQVYDCAGQELCVNNYLGFLRESTFTKAEVVVYVFDVMSTDKENDMHYYLRCLEAIKQFSPDAHLFCFLHKMDLIPVEQRECVFLTRQQELNSITLPFNCYCFPTTIWDDSLYGAWSQIIYKLVPNMPILESNIAQLCNILKADEIVIFEKATFLTITHYERKKHSKTDRFEKISSVIKHFKFSCNKAKCGLTSIIINCESFRLIVDSFTNNTYIMIVVSDPNLTIEFLSLNIKQVLKSFEFIDMCDSRSFTRHLTPEE